MRSLCNFYFIPTTQWCVCHSHSTRPLARPLREANAAAARTHGRGNTPGQHPSRREHATVLFGMLCAHNGTKHRNNTNGDLKLVLQTRLNFNQSSDFHTFFFTRIYGFSTHHSSPLSASMGPTLTCSTAGKKVIRPSVQNELELLNEP